MSLTLGKSFDREYRLQVPFLSGYYDVGIFFNKKSSFVLFSVNSNFSNVSQTQPSVKVNMFKNLESSKFCETFLELHNYRNSNLDILNQFHCIKPEYYTDVNFILNETVNLSKIKVADRNLYETLTIYGLTLTTYGSEFIFLIAERQNIITKLSKKIVRTTAVQIATSSSLNLLDEYFNESKKYRSNTIPVITGDPEKVIKLNDEE